ncbi:hypothetical protein QQ054_10200 [Oscillatoria amoena NRMC-F 0135]|nr:hypothetical protein [Oscillatoria amoena NRMC-F 0135]
MKLSRVTMVIVFVLAGVVAFGQAQSYAFKVVANKGNNEVKSGDSWQPVKTGATLKPTDEIKVADNSYIGLFHASGKPMEIKAAGNYKVSLLESQVGSGASSVLNKYTDFILSSNSEERKNKLSATGAVHRGTADDISVMLPSNQNSSVYNNVAVIRWESEKTKGPYIVNIVNMFGDNVARVETADSRIELNLSDSRFTDLSALLIEVSAKTDAKLASEQYLIKRLSPADQEKVKKSLGEIATDVSERTALNQFVLAGFYEEKGLLIDAISAYEETIRLAPDVPYYAEAYNDFLIRQGLKKK